MRRGVLHQEALGDQALQDAARGGSLQVRVLREIGEPHSGGTARRDRAHEQRGALDALRTGTGGAIACNGLGGRVRSHGHHVEHFRAATVAPIRARR
ncbi:MAG: hypothetical protein AMXMBFR42_07270 [Burkholderiales bacterium]